MFCLRNLSKNRFISVLIVLILLISMVLSSFTVSYAGLPVVIAVGGLAATGALLYGIGYAALTQQNVIDVYADMGEDLKSMIDSLTWTKASDGMGLMQAAVSDELKNEFLEWWNGSAADGILPSSNNVLQTNYVKAPNLIYKSYIFNLDMTSTINNRYQELINDYEYVIEIWSGTEMDIFYSNTQFILKGDNYTNEAELRNIGGQYNYSNINEKWNGSDYVVTVSNGVLSYRSSAVWAGHNNIKLAKGAILIQDSQSNDIGVIYGYGSEPENNETYTYTNQYSGTLPPVITAPVNSAPDTNVNAAENNSVDLDTIIAGYGSLENFFNQGGTVTMADGTVISGATGVNDLSRATDTQASDITVTTGQEVPWEYDIPILGDILRWLQKIFQAIKDGVAQIIADILAGITAIFIPPDFTPLLFIQDWFDDITAKFGNASVDFTAYGATEIPDITCSYGTVVDNSFIRDNIGFFRAIIQGFFALLLIVYNYKMITHLFGGSGDVTATALKDLNSPGNIVGSGLRSGKGR